MWLMVNVQILALTKKKIPKNSSLDDGMFCQQLNEEVRQWRNCSGWGSRRISAFLFYTVKKRISIISIPSEVKYELDSDKVIGGYWESSWKSESDNFPEQRAGVTVSQFCILNLNAGQDSCTDSGTMWSLFGFLEERTWTSATGWEISPLKDLEWSFNSSLRAKRHTV